MPISVVVVEAHHHILEHVHYILRRRLRKSNNGNGVGGRRGRVVQKKWSMLHFDSHPDLAANPYIPAMAYFLPRKEWDSVNEDVDHHHDQDQDSTAKGTSTSMSFGRFIEKQQNENGDDGEGEEISQDDDDDAEGKNLYDLLDKSVGGIAEWILPLVFGGGLEQVLWIKNEWCHQFNKGHYEFRVGAWNKNKNLSSVSVPVEKFVKNGGSDIGNGGYEVQSFLDLPDEAVLKSSLMHPYYIDDDSYVPEKELLLKENLELIVSEIDTDEKSEKSLFQGGAEGGTEGTKTEEVEVKDWILDVCLDYFFCSNPFLDEIRCINNDIADLFLKAADRTVFRQDMNNRQDNLDEEEYIEYMDCLEGFNSSVQIILKDVATLRFDRSHSSEIRFERTAILKDDACIKKLHSFYSESEGEVIWDDLVQAILNEQNYAREKLITMMLNALPNLSLPHDDENYINFAAANGELPLLLQVKVKRFGNYLRCQEWMNDANGRKQFCAEPMLISVARSSDDGYTPIAIVEVLQSAVLNEIHSIYCKCSSTKMDGSGNCEFSNDGCDLHAVYDYGEYEGSSLENLKFL